MTQISVAEAKEQLEAASDSYREIELALNNPVLGESTPERVVRSVELQGALHDASQNLIEAKNTFARVEKDAASKRRERAEHDLGVVETELVGAVAQAETDIQNLVTSLTRVLNLSKKRFGHRQEATGRAPRSMLARNSTIGWLTWRLWDLDLPGLDSPAHHHRAPLADLLGLAQELNEPGGQK